MARRVIVDVRGERVQQVTIKHPTARALAMSKARAPEAS